MAQVAFSGSVVYSLGGMKQVEVVGENLGEVLKELERRFPILEGKLLTEGEMGRRFVVTIDGVNARLAGGLLSPLEAGSNIRIINMLTGG